METPSRPNPRKGCRVVGLGSTTAANTRMQKGRIREIAVSSALGGTPSRSQISQTSPSRTSARACSSKATSVSRVRWLDRVA